MPINSAYDYLDFTQKLSPLLCSLLNGSNDLKLIRYVIWCINQLAEDSDTSNELRRCGVIPLLISHLQYVVIARRVSLYVRREIESNIHITLSPIRDRKYSNQNDVTAPASATITSRPNPLLSLTSDDDSTPLLGDGMLEQVSYLITTCCTVSVCVFRNAICFNLMLN